MTPWRSANSPYSRGWFAGYDGWERCPSDGLPDAYALGKAARLREIEELRAMFKRDKR